MDPWLGQVLFGHGMWFSMTVTVPAFPLSGYRSELGAPIIIGWSIYYPKCGSPGSYISTPARLFLACLIFLPKSLA